MAISNHLISYFLIFVLCIIYVESANPIAQYCNKLSNTSTVEITKNIDSVLAKLVQNTHQSGYNLTEVGDEGTGVMGLGHCRGDVPSQECSTCIQIAAKEIKRICPNRVDARLWYEYCFIRYDTKDFAREYDSGFRVVYYNVEYMPNPKAFKKTLMELADRIIKSAIEPDSKGFGKGEAKLSDSETLYALFQCTRDLPNYYCEMCLEITKSKFRSICENKKGCRIIFSSCYARYELYPFFFPNDQELSLESSSIRNYFTLVRLP